MIRGYISEANLIYLQHIIRVLNRADLLATTIEYAEKRQHRVLHFYETKADIRSDHKLVRIHVRGIRCQTWGHLETIRMTISQILSVPPEDVVVAGIEAANSLYITFTLPTIYVETFEKFLEDKTKHHILKPLVNLGTDRITIVETSFELAPGEETQISDDKSDRIKIIHKLQLELQQKACQIKQLKCPLDPHYLKENNLRQRRYREDEVSSTENLSRAKQSIRKRKPLSDLKVYGNKRSKASVEKEKMHPRFVSKPEKKQERHPMKRLKAENRPKRILEPHDPIIKNNVILQNKKWGDKKMQQIAHMSISVRKNTFNLYPPSTKQVFPTLEEINAQSLYAKVNRVFPIIVDPRKKSAADSNEKQREN